MLKIFQPTSDPTPKELLKTSSVSLVQTALKLGCSYAHNGRRELSGVFAPKFMLLGRSANSRRYFSHKMLKNWIWGSAAPLGAGLQAGLCQPRAPPPSFHNQQWTLLCLLQTDHARMMPRKFPRAPPILTSVHDAMLKKYTTIYSWLLRSHPDLKWQYDVQCTRKYQAVIFQLAKLKSWAAWGSGWSNGGS